MRARTSPLPSFFPCIVAVLGMACTTPQRDTRTPAPVATTSDASHPTVTKAGDAGAATSELSGAATAKLEDAPLPWGTRPLGNGPLWTLVDGMCIHMETWPVSNGVMVVYGNALGPYTRGGDPTLARIDETGLDPTSLPLPPREKTDSFYGGFKGLSGTWPSAFVLAGATGAGGRMAEQVDVWTHDTNGWTLRVGREKDGRDGPIFTRSRPRPWRDGAWVVARVDSSEYATTARPPAFEVVTTDGSKVAPPPAGLLAGATRVEDVFTLADGTIFVSVTMGDRMGVLRSADASGKVTEHRGEGGKLVAGTKSRPVFLADGRTLRGWKEGRWVKTRLEEELVKGKSEIYSVSFGDDETIWAVLGDGTVKVETPDGEVVDRTPPVKVSTTSETAHGGVRYATGSVLDGAAFGAPWVVATDGSLFRWTGAAWESVPMPTPPFSTGAKYKAARVLARAKDDVLVNVEYAEKGRGWRTPERYRALLRTRAPQETFRCNPPTNGENYSSGAGFSSWPPLENAAPAGTCTDLVVFVHPHSARTPVGGDYATFRSALKGRKDVGESLTFVDFETRSAKNLAIRVPSKEVGVAVIDALVKQSDLRTEIVCGRPTPLREKVLDVATGRWR